MEPECLAVFPSQGYENEPAAQSMLSGGRREILVPGDNGLVRSVARGSEQVEHASRESRRSVASAQSRSPDASSLPSSLPCRLCASVSPLTLAGPPASSHPIQKPPARQSRQTARSLIPVPRLAAANPTSTPPCPTAAPLLHRSPKLDLLRPSVPPSPSPSSSFPAFPRHARTHTRTQASRQASARHTTASSLA